VCGVEEDPEADDAEQPGELPCLIVDDKGVARKEGEREADVGKDAEGRCSAGSSAEDEASEALTSGAVRD